MIFNWKECYMNGICDLELWMKENCKQLCGALSTIFTLKSLITSQNEVGKKGELNVYWYSVFRLEFHSSSVNLHIFFATGTNLFRLLDWEVRIERGVFPMNQEKLLNCPIQFPLPRIDLFATGKLIFPTSNYFSRICNCFTMFSMENVTNCIKLYPLQSRNAIFIASPLPSNFCLPPWLFVLCNNNNKPQ